jgi:hypothetical protein
MAFLGMRGTGNWGPEERPTNYRQGILYLYPNGSAPLTAILSKIGEKKVDDAQFTWWTKTLASQGGSISGVFKNTNLTTAYSSGGVTGDTLFVKTSAERVSEFKVTHDVLLRLSTNLNLDTHAKVTAVVSNGANSYIACKLLENDDNGGSVKLASADTILIVGNINAEGGPMPDAIAYDPVKYFNYVQTFRTSLSLSRIARRTRLRTADAYKEARRESLELHSIEIEKEVFWGIATEIPGDNGKLERTTRGIIPFIKEYAPANVSNYITDPTFAGKSWLSGGEEWFDMQLEQNARFGARDKLIFAGSGAVLGVNRLAKSSGQIQLTGKTKSYGLEIMEWRTPFGVYNIMIHPLFSYDVATRNCMVILEPSELKTCIIDDTHFVEDDGKHGASRMDGTNEEWITDIGLELHHPAKFSFLSGINQDNTLTP